MLLTVHFSAALKALVIGNLFKVFRLDIAHRLRTGSLPLTDKDDWRSKYDNLLILFIIIKGKMFACECDGKSFKLE